MKLFKNPGVCHCLDQSLDINHFAWWLQLSRSVSETWCSGTTSPGGHNCLNQSLHCSRTTSLRGYDCPDSFLRIIHHFPCLFCTPPLLAGCGVVTGMCCVMVLHRCIYRYVFISPPFCLIHPISGSKCCDTHYCLRWYTLLSGMVHITVWDGTRYCLGWYTLLSGMVQITVGNGTPYSLGWYTLLSGMVRITTWDGTHYCLDWSPSCEFLLIHPHWKSNQGHIWKSGSSAVPISPWPTMLMW